MSRKRISASDPRMKQAIAEMKALILNRYPDATFEVERGCGEDPDGLYMWTTVDLEDTTEVLDLIGGRVVDLQVDEGLPLYVIPQQPLARALEGLRQGKQG